jgi:acetoin utilization protein AcuC
LALVQVNDPSAPRYSIDRDDEGHDTLLGTASRNLPEEARALADGLAPGQVRRGLRMLGRVLECMDGFCRLLGRDFYLVEPLFYHSALLYERHGCDYFVGRDRMDLIHRGFQPGGDLWRRLDGSTPFRRRGSEGSVRGRSWAIHDGILGESFAGTGAGVKMYRVPGRRAGVSTFPGCLY